MFKLVVGVGIASLFGAGVLFAHLYLGFTVPGLDIPTAIQPTSPRTSAIGKVARERPMKRHTPLSARTVERYSIDPDTLGLAKRTAASIGRKSGLSADSVRLYKDVVTRAEGACRNRNAEACWHRGQMAGLARESSARKWTQKAKLYANNFLRRCESPSPECTRIKMLVKEMQKSSL